MDLHTQKIERKKKKKIKRKINWSIKKKIYPSVKNRKTNSYIVLPILFESRNEG